MPVIDHPVHNRTKFTAYDQYATCQNKVRQQGYYALTRDYKPDGTWESKQVFIYDVLSQECRYDKRQNDLSCMGCSHK